MKGKWATAAGFLAIATMTATAAGFTALPAGATSTTRTTDVSVDWKITGDWGTGFQGSVRVINNTDQAIDPWSVTIPYGNTLSSVWDATATPTSTGYRLAGPSWNKSIAPRSSATFGFLGSSKGTPLAPTSCTITIGTCAILNSDTLIEEPVIDETVTEDVAVPVPTPTPTPTPTPSTGTSEAAVTIGVKVTSDWGTGRNVDLTVTNTGNTTINGWSVSMPWAGTSVSMWNATSRLSGGVLSATNASWNGTLAPGNSATVGLTDTGTFTAPVTCTSTAGSCAIAGSGSIAPVTPSPEVVVPVVKPVPTTPYTPKSGSYTGTQKIIAYYPAWATYGRNYQVADIPEQKITHINYAFANVQNGKCVLGDSYADIDKAFAGDSWDQGALRGNFNQLEKLKAANPKLRTMISLGGWTWSQNFPTAAATEESRTEFVSSCVTFMKQYGFDGIDVDWEYPVSGGLFQGTAADKENYAQLLEKFRTVLNTEETKDGQDYYLSIAAPAGPTIISNLEVGKLGGILDWMNLMSYDFHGSWDPITGHNAPMSVGPKDTASAFSITDAVNTYLDGGFPANKLVLGVAFYGRGWDNVASTAGGLYQSGAGASVGTWEKGVFDYTDIRNNYLPTMQRYWDADAQVPYLYDAVRKLWISYDDPQSIKVKADFIKAKGLGGAMIWEITGDRDKELLDTLVANL